MQTTFASITITTAEGKYFFSPEEIIRLEASSNYTRIYFTGRTKMVTAKVLKEFEEMLEPYGFIRTHRTHLVNKQHILYIKNNGSIVMKDSSVAEISRRMKTGVMQVLKNAA